MNADDMPRFAVAMNGLAASFRQEPSKALLHGYRIGLEDLPIEAVETAVARALKECTFMPPPAELRKLSGCGMTPDDRAVLAWEVFQEAVSHHGYYESVNFDDPVINATVRNLGGWMPLIERLDVDDLKWVRKEFLQTYAALARTGISREAGLALLGFCDQQNQLTGYPDAVKEPVLIECGLPPHGPGVALPAIPQGGTVFELTGPDRRNA